MKRAGLLLLLIMLGSMCFAQTAEETKNWIISKLEKNLKIRWWISGCEANPNPTNNTSFEFDYEYLTIKYVKKWDGYSTGHECSVYSGTYDRKARTVTDDYAVRINLKQLDSTYLLNEKKIYSTISSNSVFMKGTTVFVFDREYWGQQWRDVPNDLRRQDGYTFITPFEVSESIEPDLCTRLWKAIQHYLKVMPVKKQTEIF